MSKISKQTVSVFEQEGSTPSNESGSALIYAKDVGGVSKIHTLTSDGVEVELTPTVVSSLADLRDIDGPLTNNTNVVYTLLYHTSSGDGGGGTFVWDAAETASDDNGIYILPTGHVGAGRWVRVIVENKSANVLWFGAGAGGDVSAAFNSAIATGSVFVPDGNYSVKNIDLFSDLKIHFESQKAVLVGVLSTDTVFNAPDASGLLRVTIRNGTIKDCGKAFDLTPAINSSIAYCVFENISVYNCVTCFELNQSTGNMWLNCRFGADGTVGNVTGDAVVLGDSTFTNVAMNTFRDCYFIRIVGKGVRFGNNTQVKKNNFFEDCWFENIDDCAIATYEWTENLCIRGGHFEKCGNVSGEYILVSNIKATIDPQFQNPTVNIEGVGFNPSNGASYAVRCVGAARLTAKKCGLHFGWFLRVEGDHQNEEIVLDSISIRSALTYDTRLVSDGGATNLNVRSRRTDTYGFSSDTRSEIQKLDKRLVTVNATAATIATIPTTVSGDSFSYTLKMLFTADDETADEFAKYEIEAFVVKVAGVLIVKDVTTIYEYEDDVTWDAGIIGTSGDDITISVQGDATNSVKWRALIDVITHK